MTQLYPRIQHKRTTALDRQNGQDSLECPTRGGWSFTTLVAAANRAWVSRAVVPRRMVITNVGFYVSVAATVDDPIQVFLLDRFLNVLGSSSSGGTNGLVNSLGLKSLALSSSVEVGEGQVVYAGLAYGTVGGTAATLAALSLSSSAFSQIHGSAAGVFDIGFKDTSYPTPNPFVNGGTIASIPWLTLREN